MARPIYKTSARPLRRALERLYDDGKRLPRLDVGTLRFALHPASGRLYVTLAQTKRLGTILRNGIFRPVEDITPTENATVLTVLDDILGAVKTLSAFTPSPKCAVCGIPLGHAIDRTRGIGDKCWRKGEFWRVEKRSSGAGTRSSKLAKRRKVRPK